MYKEKAVELTTNECARIITRASEMIEDFLDGKCPEKYGSTQLTRDLSAEMNANISLVSPIVSILIKNDERVESNRGRYHGGLAATEVGKKYRTEKQNPQQSQG